VDLDADGYNDILSGSYSRHSQPMAGLFQVLWGQPDGSFREAAVLEGTDGEPLIIPADEQTIVENICTRPTAVDWDRDGDLDLVVGNFAGSFYVFTGEGKGQFSPTPAKLLTGDEPLKIEGAHSDPFLIDWDGDGDLDLFSGSSNGGVQWAKNTADSGAVPTFDRFQHLIVPSTQVHSDDPLSETELSEPAGSTRVWIDDVNEDGKLDLLLGDSITLVSPAEGLTVKEFDEARGEWQNKFTAVMEEYRAAGQDQDELNAAIEKVNKLYKQRSEFIIEDRTGFVWLYLKK